MNALRFLSIREFGPVRPSGETDFDGGDLGVESSLSGNGCGNGCGNGDVDNGGNGCGAGNTVTADAAFGTIAGALSLLFSGSCVLG